MNNLSRFRILIGIFSISLIQCSLASVASTGDFNKDFFVTWSPSHVNTSADGGTRSLKLDKDSGSGFASNDMFLFGQFDMQIKLIPDNSAGTVVAFYVSSTEMITCPLWTCVNMPTASGMLIRVQCFKHSGHMSAPHLPWVYQYLPTAHGEQLTSGQPNRDEVDFEFLGNVPGQPYILQTNVYVDGYDGREQRIKLWFDPTKEFHTYSILWNLHQIVFMVDWIPIRTHRNHAEKGVAFPRFQPMSLQMSIWDGNDWATDGGKNKIDWSKSPFIASFKNHKIDACIWKGNPRFCRENSPTNWWNSERFNSLTWAQRRLFRWVRRYYLIYDYCMDNQRFKNNLPKECSLTKY